MSSQTMKRIAAYSLSLLLSLALIGCASNTRINRMTEAELGNAAKHLAESQTAADPDDATGPPLDGKLAQKVTDQYRKDVAKPKEIRNTININVGN